MSYTLISLSFFVAFTLAMPQYGNQPQSQPQIKIPQNSQGGRQPNLPQGCRIEYRTIYDIVEVEEFETKYKRQCKTEFQRICSPYREQNCQTKYEKKCETLTRNKCYEAFKDVPWDTEECKEETVRKCDKHWVTNGGAKEWADNPSTCKNLKETKCYPVTKIRKEPYQQCDKENYQECNDYPREICNWVTKEKCENEPYQDCQEVPYQEHKLVPKQVSKRKPFKVCQDIDPYEFSDAEILEYDFSDYDSRIADPRNSGDDEEIVDNEKQVQSDSAITFG